MMATETKGNPRSSGYAQVDAEWAADLRRIAAVLLPG